MDDDWPSFYTERRVRVHLADPRVPEPLRRRYADRYLPRIEAVLDGYGW